MMNFSEELQRQNCVSVNTFKVEARGKVNIIYQMNVLFSSLLDTLCVDELLNNFFPFFL